MQNDITAKSRKWIFIRGLRRHSGYWHYFIRHFNKYFPQDEVELIDLPGIGSEWERASLLSIPEIVDDLRRRSRFLEKSQKLNFLTISMGSMIGVEWARRYPEEVNLLICINTSDKGTAHIFERLQPGMLKNIVKKIRSSEAHDVLLEEAISAAAKNVEEAAVLRREFTQYPTPSIRNILRQLYSASSYAFPKEKPAVPIFFLRSLGDELCHPVCTEKICKMWNLDFDTHTTGGHDLLLHEPEWICERISEYGSAD